MAEDGWTALWRETRQQRIQAYKTKLAEYVQEHQREHQATDHLLEQLDARRKTELGKYQTAEREIQELLAHIDKADLSQKLAEERRLSVSTALHALPEEVNRQIEQLFQHWSQHAVPKQILIIGSPELPLFALELSKRSDEFKAYQDFTAQALRVLRSKVGALERTYKTEKTAAKEQYAFANQAHAEKKKTLLHAVARELHEGLEEIVGFIDEEKNTHPALDKAIYSTLFTLEQTQAFPLKPLAPYSRDILFSRIEALVQAERLSVQDATRVLSGFVEELSEEILPVITETTPAPIARDDARQVRSTILGGIFGHRARARQMLNLNPGLADLAPGVFETYVGKLKHVWRIARESAHASFPDIDTDPSFYATPVKVAEALREYQTTGEDLTEASLNRQLIELGYRPALVHAVIRAFKPTTARYVGNHRISFESVRKNAQSLLTPDEAADLEKCLHKLCADNVVLRGSGNNYSLSPIMDDIQTPTLRAVVSLYLR